MTKMGSSFSDVGRKGIRNRNRFILVERIDILRFDNSITQRPLSADAVDRKEKFETVSCRVQTINGLNP